MKKGAQMLVAHVKVRVGGGGMQMLVAHVKVWVWLLGDRVGWAGAGEFELICARKKCAVGCMHVVARAFSQPARAPAMTSPPPPAL